MLDCRTSQQHRTTTHLFGLELNGGGRLLVAGGQRGGNLLEIGLGVLVLVLGWAEGREKRDFKITGSRIS